MSSQGCRAFAKNGKGNPCKNRAKENGFCGRHRNYLEKNPNGPLQEPYQVEVKSRSRKSSTSTTTKKRYTNDQIGYMLESLCEKFEIPLPWKEKNKDKYYSEEELKDIDTSSDEQEIVTPPVIVHKKKEVRRRAPPTPIQEEVKPFSFIKESKLKPIFPIVQNLFQLLR
jgi:hypothetical protein